ncbi:hypothetical protein EJ04DRAFT_525999 [Polyplosphaeria fusca]|uniref:Uncharacterized protein n=1 Tax=Polyplosphaeria fusca TaxID=682080 RepID=A0A9P4QU28_9PLEO|nr:hypothetical protein EJ04DRAFT_525999 [Polyplosphaeria fusca]
MTTPTKIDDPYKIPGAILFMTITFKVGTVVGMTPPPPNTNAPNTNPPNTGTPAPTGTPIVIQAGKQDMNVVAYDPKFVATDTLDQIKSRYGNDGLPYFERFSLPGAPPAVFQVDNGGVYFVGAFGGKDRGSPKSIKWEAAVTGDHVVNGLSLVYWNQKISASDIRQGMYTAPAHGRFTANAKATIMSVYNGPGPGRQVVPQSILQLGELEKVVMHYYATNGNENANLRPS